ncbi:hypothetical protein J6590_099552 [Homalodisca vitripennis]|nr:hypothetical protein J6590_027980 [Homalodisca vitripennis]KAG8284599.1 hypothetical protein J6590_099552 [Homalodisca vitripennis]
MFDLPRCLDISKYELFPQNQHGSIFLTPSPSDLPMTPVTIIDVPDNSGNYINDRNQENVKRSQARPGGAVKVTDEGGRGVKVRFQDEILSQDDLDDLPKVEIQITEDGTIQVISDKETTV